MVQDDITILIKTFNRPEAAQRLIKSIRLYYPTIAIVIVNDGDDRYNMEIWSDYIDDFTNYIGSVEFDIGLSAGRNLGVDHISTPYVFICDDDCIFTKETNLERAEILIDISDIDILAIDAGVGYCGIFKKEGDIVRYERLTRGTNMGVILYDFVPNIFIAYTDSLSKHPWSEDLKMGEHFAYFYDHLGKIKVGWTDEVAMKHEHISSPEYNKYRGRAIEYVKQYMKKKGINKRITFDGIDEV